jgi:hypothetical protein
MVEVKTSNLGRHAIKLALAFVLAVLTLGPFPASAAPPVHVHFFWSEGCFHCREMATTLKRITREERAIVLHSYEVTRSAGNAALFDRVVEGLELPPAVPVVVIGDAATVGHGRRTEADVRRMIAKCRAGPCPDSVSQFLPRSEAQPPPARPPPSLQIPTTVDVPLFGEIRTATLSLPLLTIILGAIDGFNPCALWVLVFLLGLLLGIRDRRRMWLLAGTFLLATAAVYFLVLAAWLNVLLIIGTLAWVRIAVGGIALLAGGIYLREGLRGDDVCDVTRPERRRLIFERLRALVRAPNLGVAMAGTALLAIAVNFVELLCSAGIPAVYTGILAQADLPALSYYFYLALYVLVFLADDTALVVLALVTLRVAATDRGYARWIRLAGGVLMLSLGLILIFRPAWLSFAIE